jgi:leucine dehydrogenase
VVKISVYLSHTNAILRKNYRNIENQERGVKMIFQDLEEYGCEEVTFFYDKGVGLKAIIAIHDTTLGPALGGTRMWDYHSEQEALIDALGLARGMTRKASISGLDCGGGKAVVMGNSCDKTEAMIRAYAQCIDSLKGRLITGQDVGIDVEDTLIMKQETEYILGTGEKVRDPSRFTAHGTLFGMRACAKEVFGNPRLSGLRVAMQGVGHVGYHLAHELHNEGVKLIVSDIREERTKRVADECNAGVVPLEEIYSADCDIFAPCALGAIINDETIPKLKCGVVAGSANNQLKENAHGNELHKRGILYAPDYVINAGGLIAAYMEWKGNTIEQIMNKVEQIGDRIEEIIATSKKTGEPTYRITHKLAEARIRNKRREQGTNKKA